MTTVGEPVAAEQVTALGGVHVTANVALSFVGPEDRPPVCHTSTQAYRVAALVQSHTGMASDVADPTRMPESYSGPV